MNEAHIAKINSFQEAELINNLLEAQERLIRLYESSQASLAEAASLHRQGMTSWSSEELKLVFQPSSHRLMRLLSIWKIFRMRHLISASGLYDRDWYLTKYSDVSATGVDPDFHFLLNGIHEGRDPGPAFSQVKYALRYKDVLLSRTNPLIHYICHGSAEGRSSFPAEQ